MTLEAQINFYLAERWPKTLFTVSRNGDKKERDIEGYHFQFIAWRKIIRNYHPRKFAMETEIRAKAALLCKNAIEYRLSKTRNPEEAQELKTSYKSILNAEAKQGKPTEILS